MVEVRWQQKFSIAGMTLVGYRGQGQIYLKSVWFEIQIHFTIGYILYNDCNRRVDDNKCFGQPICVKGQCQIYI